MNLRSPHLTYNIPAPFPSQKHYANGDVGGILFASAGIAFVAVLESLISAKCAANKTGEK